MGKFRQFLESQQSLKETDYNGLVKDYKGIPGLKIKIVDVGTDRNNYAPVSIFDVMRQIKEYEFWNLHNI